MTTAEHVPPQLWGIPLLDLPEGSTIYVRFEDSPDGVINAIKLDLEQPGNTFPLPVRISVYDNAKTRNPWHPVSDRVYHLVGSLWQGDTTKPVRPEQIRRSELGGDEPILFAGDARDDLATIRGGIIKHVVVQRPSSEA